ncbi:hypothetical protein KXR87_20225 [Yokenella regensburgei]|uniref:hypothetical protein n=1 Tax=Yokenella regensburgei TaxID=158877 RepID=UPI003F163236
MKFNDERTGLIGLAIGAAVIGLVSSGQIINRDNIIKEIERQGRNRGDGIEDEIFMEAALLVMKGR